MPHSRQVPEPWKSFLRELDREATAETRLDCMGGFVATLQYGLPRATSDLDVLLIAPGEQRAPLFELGIRGGALHKKYKVFLDYVGVATVPEDYEERLIEMLPGAYKHLRNCALDPYYLAPSKLERNIQRDRDDVKHLAQSVPLDLKILKERYEKRASLAAWKSPTRGLNSKTLDRDDRGREKQNRGPRQALKNLPFPFPFASQRSAS